MCAVFVSCFLWKENQYRENKGIFSYLLSLVILGCLLVPWFIKFILTVVATGLGILRWKNTMQRCFFPFSL